jgi:hypothetical protein
MASRIAEMLRRVDASRLCAGEHATLGLRLLQALRFFVSMRAITNIISL